VKNIDLRVIEIQICAVGTAGYSASDKERRKDGKVRIQAYVPVVYLPE